MVVKLPNSIRHAFQVYIKYALPNVLIRFVFLARSIYGSYKGDMVESRVLIVHTFRWFYDRKPANLLSPERHFTLRRCGIISRCMWKRIKLSKIGQTTKWCFEKRFAYQSIILFEQMKCVFITVKVASPL